MRALYILVAGSAVAHAAPLEGRWLDSENVHLADQRGAMNHHLAVSWTLELGAGNKAKLVDTGEWRDHQLYEDGTTSEDKVAWTNTWTGTWKQPGGKLALTLKLANRACTAAKTWNRGRPETRPCLDVSRQLALTCTTETLQVEDAAGKPLPAPAWRCRAAEPVELAATPNDFVFGKLACIEVGAGRRAPKVYRRCATP